MSEQEQGAISATFKANVDMQPKASQIFLVGIIALAAFCMACGTFLLSGERPNSAGWACFGLTGLFGLTAVLSWRKSQSDSDLHSAVPTTVSLPDGLVLTTDSRNLRSTIAVQGLRQLCEAPLRRKLPDADGIVENGVVIPGSEALANSQVQRINDEVEAQAILFENLVNRTTNGPSSTQIPSGDIPPDDIGSRLNYPTPNETARE